jgi:hypothetical protein
VRAFVRKGEHGWQDFQTERLGGFEIDDQFELGRLLTAGERCGSCP